jgi:hypothetical protein
MAYVLACKQGWNPEFKGMYYAFLSRPAESTDLTPAFGNEFSEE